MHSDIAYPGQVAMFCLLDAEWSRRRFADYIEPFRRVQRQVDDVCCDYRKRINESFDSFLEANLTRNSHLSHAKLEPHLYEPLFYIPLGESDTLAIILVDSLDAVSHLTTKLKTSVERIEFGFCPTLDGFGDAEGKHQLVNLDRLLSHKLEDSDGQNGGFKQHSFQQELPLLMLTNFKVDWWGTVGFAMLFEQLLLKAINKRVRDTLEELESLCGDRKHGSLFEKDDITSLRYSVVDLQGEEELAILLFCRNYAVAMSLIASLRCLTLKDILQEDADNALEEAILGCSAHRAVWSLYRSLCRKDSGATKIPPEFDFKRVSDNHIFRWTKSLLAVSPSTLFGNDHSNCHGHVEARGHFRVAPGHDWTAYHKILQNRLGPDRDAASKEHELRYRVGVVDSAVDYGQGQMGENANTSLTLDAALHVIRENLDVFGSVKMQGAQTESDRHTRLVVDATTWLDIPLPNLQVLQTKAENHEPLLLKTLPHLQERIFYPTDDGADDADVRDYVHPGQMDLSELALAIEKCGVPAELRRTILALYRDFAAFVADPFLFDSVLDLYDAFATLYGTLTMHIPRHRARMFLQSADEWLPPLDAERVAIVTQMVQGLHNALVHRIGRMYPESPVRQISIDFRGGLTQVILAANAPLTCGLGLLRKYVVGIGPDGSSRRTVGGLTSVTLNPGTKACWFNLEAEKPIQLALIEVDVPHVLHPASYADYLHECAHLIYRSFTWQQMTGLALASITVPQMVDRVQEIFANLVTYLMLYVGDSDTFPFHHLLSYAQRHSRRSAEDIEIIVPFSEFLIRLFLVADCVEPGTPRSSWLERPWRRRRARMAKVTEAFQRFLAKASSFLPDYETLWKGATSPGQLYCMRQFRDLYPKIALYMPEIWLHAVYVLREFYRHDLHGTADKDPQLELYPEICKALREGRPLIRCLCSPDHGTTRESDSDKTAPDVLALGCAILHQYLSRIREAEGKQVYLRRDREHGKVVYTDTGKVWYDFQLESGAASMFCPVPLERSNRLKKEIVILKSFWDIAANLRARRLEEMIMTSQGVGTGDRGRVHSPQHR